jgi:hypothetical protein
VVHFDFLFSFSGDFVLLCEVVKFFGIASIQSLLRREGDDALISYLQHIHTQSEGLSSALISRVVSTCVRQVMQNDLGHKEHITNSKGVSEQIPVTVREISSHCKYDC